MAAALLNSPAHRLLNKPAALQTHIQHALQVKGNPHPVWDNGHPVDNGLSVVIFLLGLHRPAPDQSPEPCVILNKRSAKVRQPGDICCPGGGVSPRVDRLTAHLLRLPGSPLRQWAYYRFWRKRSSRRMARLRLLLATALREGVEEMRLNPLAVCFQGVLPTEQLVLFRRTIIPMVAWVRWQRRYVPNWEVERIVRVPIRALLDPGGYVGLRLRMGPRGPHLKGEWQEFPAFRHRSSESTEIIWGATYRITTNFLERVFGFVPPAPEAGAVVEKRLTRDYLSGRH